MSGSPPVVATDAPPRSSLGLVVVRRGVLPAGADEVTAEAGGRVLLVGDGVAAAATDLTSAADVTLWEAGEFAPAAWSAVLAAELDGGTIDADVIIMPASPDGRDFAPRLAATLGRGLVANAIAVRAHEIVAARYDGRLAEHSPVRGPVVVTLIPGVRGVAPCQLAPRIRTFTPAVPDPAVAGDPEVVDAEVLAVLPADPATIALTEASRIVGGGHGMGSADAFALLADVAAAIGASLGGTRVVADLDWIPFERQIGTTGAIVAPRLYLAFGVSGAVQHTSGLGSPDHVISVNLDGSAPMMAMADLAIVADAPAVVAELRRQLAGPAGVATERTAGERAPAVSTTGERAPDNSAVILP
ncbi:mycofactocin-associated electron transfer flavoprotein alpha subunit [Frankia sp. Cas4]|uniref:mycofactocin-associated electron transfer flavoprotein alpha subunit n=1 Tax=Frankia sp. Cas4 TaxID=3073927 RepID=UPI002AD438A3|nr:mycofactocin-associated electron transfer flavoprotein alpha subunit [Frankia sp. Cas4]